MNVPLYALGEAYMQGGRIFPDHQKSSDLPFIVTAKFKEPLVKGKKNSQNFALIGGIASAVIGVVLIVANFF